MLLSGRIIAIALTLSIALPVLLPATPVPQLTMIATGETQIELLDPAWLPWLGCWEPTTAAVSDPMIEDTGRDVVCVAPRLDRLGVNLTTYMGSQVIAQNTVIADGRKRTLPEADCRGTQIASWSADGHRLYSSVMATCANENEYSLVGLNLLVKGGHWIELQSVSFDNGDHRELVVRQYSQADSPKILGSTSLEPRSLSSPDCDRLPSSVMARRYPRCEVDFGFTLLDVDDILEASDRVPVEVVEAAILESNSLFSLDGDALIRLAEAGVDEQIIDLMVAISYPNEFVVDSSLSSSSGRGVSTGHGGYVTPYYGYYNRSCWGPYYGPIYGPYGPRCSHHFYSPYYDYYRPYSRYYRYSRPYYYGGGRGNISTPSIPPTGSLYGGKVIRDRGYVTVRRVVGHNGSKGDSVSSGAMRSNSSLSGRSSVSRRGYKKAGSSGGSSSTGKARSGSTKAKPKGGSNN